MEDIPREQKKRILDRDQHRCVLCYSKYNLHIHHFYNWSGKLKKFEDSLGSYPYVHTQDHDLVTLCSSCHGKIHRCDKSSPIYRYLEKYLAKFYTGVVGDSIKIDIDKIIDEIIEEEAEA